MASIRKRGNSYQITVSNGYDTRSEPMIISQIAKLFNMVNQYVYQVSKKHTLVLNRYYIERIEPKQTVKVNDNIVHDTLLEERDRYTTKFRNHVKWG